MSFPYASNVDHTPRAGDKITLDDGRNVIVVNSNGRSHWFHAFDISDLKPNEIGSFVKSEVFLCLYSTYSGRA